MDPDSDISRESPRLANIEYRLVDVLNAHVELETRPEAVEHMTRCHAGIVFAISHEAGTLLDRIKSDIEAGHRVFVRYPEGRGWWRLSLDESGNLIWRCQHL